MNSKDNKQFPEISMDVDVDFDVFLEKLCNCLSRINEENEGSKRRLADLGIHVIPEDVRSQLSTIADFQILHKIDEIDDISIGLGASESILKGVKQDAMKRELKKGTRRLRRQKKQLSLGKDMLMRDEKLYEEDRTEKEKTCVRLKSDIVLLQPELDEYAEALEEIGMQENSINSSFEEIKDLHEKITELTKQIQAEKSYLSQFAGLPPSLSEAAHCNAEIKDKIRKINIAVQENLSNSNYRNFDS